MAHGTQRNRVLDRTGPLENIDENAIAWAGLVNRSRLRDPVASNRPSDSVIFNPFMALPLVFTFIAPCQTAALPQFWLGLPVVSNTHTAFDSLLHTRA
jgi:hypothetical protein